MTLGSLVVSLEANIASFQSDLGKAVTMAEASMHKISKAVEQAKGAFELLGVGFSVYKLFSLSSEVIKATAHLKELSVMSGIAVPALSAIGVEATKLGMNIDDAVGAFDKMQKNAAQAVGGNKAQLAAFDAIGVSAQQLAKGLKDPQQLMLDISGAMEKFADDGNKTAVMMTLFGRSGAHMTELLHSMAENGYENANATAEQAQRAHDFEVAMASLTNTLKTWFRDALMGLIPGIKLAGTAIITSFLDIWTQMTIGSQIKWLEIKSGFHDFLADIIKGMTFVPGQSNKTIDALMGGLDKVMGSAKASTAKVIELRKQLTSELAAHDAVMGQASMDFVNTQSPPVQAAVQTLPSITVMADADSTKDMRKRLDERLKMMAQQITAEDALAKMLNKTLDSDYANGAISLAAYSDQKIQVLNDNFIATQAIYDKQIAEASAFAAKVKDKDERAIALSKVEDLKSKKGAAGSDFDLAQVSLTDKLTASQQKLADSILGVSISYAELNREYGQSAQMQVDMQDGTLKQILLANNLTETYNQLIEVENRTISDKMLAQQRDHADALIEVAIATAQMNGETEKAAALQIDLQDASLKHTLNLAGETEALNALVEVEKRQQLYASRTGMDGVTRSLITYKQTIADVASATENMMTKAFGGMEDALVEFTTTGKLNFRSLAQSIIADMLRIMIQQSLMGAISGWMGALGGMFGAAMGGGGAGASFAGGGSTAGYLASGGPVAAGSTYMVGERGPEMFKPSAAGTIIPNGGGAMNIEHTTVVNIDARSDRAQVYAETQQAVLEGNKQLVSELMRYNPGLRL